jgi:putative ABC transport system substrate-binding protein
LGWSIGRNVQIDYRWTAGRVDRNRAFAAELIALAPDVVFTSNASLVGELQNASRSAPIVFAGIVDAVGVGAVESLARPGGNATGFSSGEFVMSGKWLELLKEIAPQVTRAAVVLGPNRQPSVFGQLGALQSAASSLGVELRPVNLRSPDEFDRSVMTFARSPNGGLIATASQTAINYRDLIVKLAARYRLPAVYSNRSFVAAGGLMSYGADIIELYRQAAGYVDRILRGAKPADLAVQQPTKFDFVLNLKTAGALGLDVPAATLLRATEVIE